MLRLRLIEERDFEKILEWNKDKDAAFLYQWAGKGYTHPLTMKQYHKRIEAGANRKGADTFIYAIDNPMENRLVGTIELTRIDYDNLTASVGRFLVGEACDRGKGYGKLALTILSEKAFIEFGIKELFLKVFDFNVGGIRCYETVGFKIVKYEENVYHDGEKSWGVYSMALSR